MFVACLRSFFFLFAFLLQTDTTHHGISFWLLVGGNFPELLSNSKFEGKRQALIGMVHHFWMLLTGNYIRCLKTVDDKFRIKRKIVREFKDISFGNSLEKGYQLCLVFWYGDTFPDWWLHILCTKSFPLAVLYQCQRILNRIPAKAKISVDGAPLDRPEIYTVCHIKTRSLKGVQKIWHMLFGGCYDRPLCNV